MLNCRFPEHVLVILMYFDSTEDLIKVNIFTIK